jgi:hypothetical protein
MSSFIYIDDTDPSVQYSGGSWELLGIAEEYNSTVHGGNGDGVLRAILTFVGGPPLKGI